jgi:hypothetical protein
MYLLSKGTWFEKPSISSTTLSKSREEEDKITLSRVNQIFDVLSALLEKNCQSWIVDLLKSIIKQESQNESKLTEVKTRLAKLCDCIVEQLLRLEETSLESPVKKAEPGKKELSRLVVYVTGLSLFSQACPTALIPHVETLEPYLKSQVGLINSLLTEFSTERRSRKCYSTPTCGIHFGSCGSFD